ncbi:MAG: hypothetical protein K2I56_02580 [Muribaculaceae bacterium]|nr:hypothetical protein [Muribaculaceae bacterium]
MSGRISQYTKYILKKIIRGVAVSDSPGLTSDNIYKFLKVELNDGIIRDIVDEGARYKLTKDQCMAEISLADKKVNVNPSIIRESLTVSIESFKVGERLDFAYHNEEVGNVIISVMVCENYDLLVLNSDIGGLRYRDILRPHHLRFNAGYNSFFDVWRKRVKLNKSGLVFCPGTLRYIERHRPGLVFDILDADDTFAYSAYDSEADSSPDSVDVDVYYASFPRQLTPPLWDEHELMSSSLDQAQCKLPFIIKSISRTTADIYANPGFRFHKFDSVRNYERNHFTACCIISGNIESGCQLTTLSPGRLSYNKAKKAWIQKVKPRVVCRQLPDENKFKIIRSVLQPRTQKTIGINDVDKKLVNLGIAVPDLMELLIDLENRANVIIPEVNYEDISTVGDLYDILLKAKAKKNGKKN